MRPCSVVGAATPRSSHFEFRTGEPSGRALRMPKKMKARQTSPPDGPGESPRPRAFTPGQSEAAPIPHGVATPRTFPFQGNPQLCPLTFGLTLLLDDI